MTDTRNTLQLIIPQHLAGCTIKQFLREELHFSMHQISRVKYRPEGFRVNGGTRRVNSTLLAGDVLSFSIDDPEPVSGTFSGKDEETFRSRASENAYEEDISILFEDDYILAADKPAGMVSHPSHGHHGDSALDILRKKYGRLYLIGRLDKDTAGVLLFARHVETASLLSKQKENGTLQKTYLAAIPGTIVPESGAITVPIGVIRDNPLKMAPDPVHGKTAVTHYRTLEVKTDGEGRTYSVLSVTIEHGRTHQIRVHLASAGHPLIGDPIYGNTGQTRISGSFSQTHTCLIASEMTFRHPYSGETVAVRSPRCSFAVTGISR